MLKVLECSSHNAWHKPEYFLVIRQLAIHLRYFFFFTLVVMLISPQKGTVLESLEL